MSRVLDINMATTLPPVRVFDAHEEGLADACLGQIEFEVTVGDTTLRGDPVALVLYLEALAGRIRCTPTGHIASAQIKQGRDLLLMAGDTKGAKALAALDSGHQGEPVQVSPEQEGGT